MVNPDQNDEPTTAEPPCSVCCHLRNKGMYVYSDGQGGESHDDYDNTIYWCVKTQKSFGPDDEYVSGEDCRNASRVCYEPL